MRAHSWPWLFLFTAMIPGHLLGWAVEWAYAAATTLWGIYRFKHFAARYPTGARVGFALTFLLTSLSLVGYAVTLALATSPTGVRDVVELAKPAMVFFSCALVLSFAPPAIDELRRACLVVLGFSVACGAVLMFQLPVMTGLVDAVYGGTKTAFADFYVRLSIPFENPNFLGLVAVLSLAIALYFGPRPDVRLAIASICAAALSGSRTAWLTAALVLALFLATAVRSWLGNIRSATWSQVALAAAIPAIVIYFGPSATESFQRLANLVELVTSFDLASDVSYGERLALRETATALILERPVVGWGALKYTSLDIVDSQYYSLALRFGLFGALVTLIAAVAIMINNIGPLARSGERKFAIMMWLVLAAWMWNGTFIENIRLSILITTILYTVSNAHARPTH